MRRRGVLPIGRATGALPVALVEWLGHGDRRIDAWGRAYAVATLVHLLLPDFDQPGWGLPRAVHLVGALALLARPTVVGFGLCLAGALWPLLALRDVLTQSMYLAWCALVAVAGLTAHRAGATRAPAGVLRAVALLTGGTYLLAAFHKLNRDFFDPAVSCAHHAWAQIVDYWPVLAAVPAGGPALSVLVIAIEVALGLAVLVRSPFAWPLGILFHLPLTVTLAPAFGAVMLSGYVAATGPRQAVRWRRARRRRPVALALGAIGLAGASWALHGGPDDPLTLAKVAAAGALVVGGLAVARRGPLAEPFRRRAARIGDKGGRQGGHGLRGFRSRPLDIRVHRWARGDGDAEHTEARRRRGPWKSRGEPGPSILGPEAVAYSPEPGARSLLRSNAAGRAGRWPALVGAAWIAHGLTPYLGVQYQHTAAMLSNLRIDPGCHNSLVVPEAVRLVDPYLRIDEASIGGGGVRPERERVLRSTLWSLAALGAMHRNWCVPDLRPIRLAGTWRGRRFTIPDLCAPDWAAPLRGPPFGPDFLPGYQALQKNLSRTCPAACIH